MIVSTKVSSAPSARAEVHVDGDQIFVEHYDSNGNCMRVSHASSVADAEHLAENWITEVQTLLG